MIENMKGVDIDTEGLRKDSKTGLVFAEHSLWLRGYAIDFSFLMGKRSVPYADKDAADSYPWLSQDKSDIGLKIVIDPSDFAEVKKGVNKLGDGGWVNNIDMLYNMIRLAILGSDKPKLIEKYVTNRKRMKTGKASSPLVEWADIGVPLGTISGSLEEVEGVGGNILKFPPVNAKMADMLIELGVPEDALVVKVKRNVFKRPGSNIVDVRWNAAQEMYRTQLDGLVSKEVDRVVSQSQSKSISQDERAKITQDITARYSDSLQRDVFHASAFKANALDTNGSVALFTKKKGLPPNYINSKAAFDAVNSETGLQSGVMVAVKVTCAVSYDKGNTGVTLNFNQIKVIGGGITLSTAATVDEGDELGDTISQSPKPDELDDLD